MWVLYCKTCKSACYANKKKSLIKMEEDHQMLNSGVREHPWKITVHDTIIKKEYPEFIRTIFNRGEIIICGSMYIYKL